MTKRTAAANAAAPVEPTTWTASWVTGPRPSKTTYPALYLWAGIEVREAPVRATGFVSSLGWHRLFVNGRDLTGPSLVPRWTPFDVTVEYIGYDVTEALASGTNTVAMAIGDGRFRGSIGYKSKRAVYGDRLAGLVQLEVEYPDGTTESFASGPGWLAGAGPIRTSDPKLGEVVDLRVPDPRRSDGPPSGFVPVEVLATPRTLIPPTVPTVTQVAELRPVAITRLANGHQVVDFGQNFAGVVRLRLRGSAGTEVAITHSELLKPDGDLNLDYIQLTPLDRWAQRDRVTLDGGERVWQPWFTIHGFRYASVAGLEADLTPDDVTGVVLSSDLEPVGEFDCSDERLNQLYRNVVWSMRSNFTDTPTDCPTRERSGWTGDIQIFAPTASLIADVHAYLRRYLDNLALEQMPDGTVPVVIPAERSAFTDGKTPLLARRTSAGWGDASVLLPWALYHRYGDAEVIERQFESMKAWVDQAADRARTPGRARRKLPGRDPELERYVLDTGFNFGEWLRPGESAMASALDAQKTSAVVATAYLEHSARLLGEMATVIGRDADAQHYRELADNVRRAWRYAFLHPDGRIGTNRQDDYVRALAFGLLESSERDAAAARLVELIEAAGTHLGTGFLSTPMLLNVLADTGHADIAWNLLLQTSSPSWLYQVEHGASTTWETWEGRDKRGRPKYSRNHYSFGSVVQFLVEQVAGLAPAAPGYGRLAIRPLVGGGLTHASARLQTPYGEAAISWRVRSDHVEYHVLVPPAVTADFQAEHDATPTELGPGEHVLTRPLTPQPGG